MLPKIELPRYTTKTPIAGDTVVYRPYLVKEEKIVLIALQSETFADMKQAIIQTLENCMLSFNGEEINEKTVDNMNFVDITYMLTKIRSASRGEHIDVVVKCSGTLESGKTCGMDVETIMDVSKMELSGDIPTENIVKINDTLSMELQIPNISMFDIIKDDGTMDVVEANVPFIKSIFDNETVYSDFTDDEIREWVENLYDTHLDQVEKFFFKIPKMQVEINYKCPSCGHEGKIIQQDVHNFLD